MYDNSQTTDIERVLLLNKWVCFVQLCRQYQRTRKLFLLLSINDWSLFNNCSVGLGKGMKHILSVFVVSVISRSMGEIWWTDTVPGKPMFFFVDCFNEIKGTNSSYKPITVTAWVRAQLCKLQKGAKSLPVARPGSVVLSEYPSFLHH
jgi:hypothetical protein